MGRVSRSLQVFPVVSKLREVVHPWKHGLLAAISVTKSRVKSVHELSAVVYRFKYNYYCI